MLFREMNNVKVGQHYNICGERKIVCRKSV